MTDADFCLFLELLSTLNDEQRALTLTSLQDAQKKALPKLYQRLEQNFVAHPRCGHCQSEHVHRHGFQHQRQRFMCKDCGRTFNALTGTPFANVKIADVLDQYLECMTTSMTLRPTARQCGISLDTSFHLRHRVMQLLQSDQAELLQGIVELDEAFFRLSHKGSRQLKEPPRKRGGIRQRPGKPGQRKHPGFKVKQVPVVVACDREHHLTSSVLSNMHWQGIEACLKGRIPPGTPLCADALSQHDKVADSLGLVLKSLVTRMGQTVREDVFHLQHVNGYHSELKAWINEHFKGVATKYLYRYLGWRRALSNCELTASRLIEKLANHWMHQPCMKACIAWIFTVLLTTNVQAGAEESIAYITKLLEDGKKVAIFLIDMQIGFQSRFDPLNEPERIIQSQIKVLNALAEKQNIYVVDLNLQKEGHAPGPTIEELRLRAIKNEHYKLWAKSDNSPFSDGGPDNMHWRHEVINAEKPGENYLIINDGMGQYLSEQNINHIFCMGCFDGGCVVQTVQDGLARGFQVIVDRELNMTVDSFYFVLNPSTSYGSTEYNTNSYWDDLKKIFPSLTILSKGLNMKRSVCNWLTH